MKITTTRYLAGLFWFLLTTLSDISAQPGRPASKPNILFIAIDDLRPELGCYGSRETFSPNIDRLAASGVKFDRAYCQLAVCNPSRVSLLTGLRPDTTRVWTLDRRFRDTLPNAVTLPGHFKNNGYHTVGFGKIFHNPWPDNESWSEPHAWPKKSRLWSPAALDQLDQEKERLRAQGLPERSINRLRAAAAEEVDCEDREHIDGAIAEQALQAMRRLAKGEKPFFLAAGFIRPHLPFVVPRKYWNLYDRTEISLAINAAPPRNAPRFALNTMYELRDYHDYRTTPDPLSGSLDESRQRDLKHGYLAAVSFVDAQVGLLLDELDRLNLTENTIVVLWSDHGWKLGEHNSWCKQTNYEIDTRVPLIIRSPGAPSNGQATRSIVELLDLFPSLCDLTDTNPPPGLEGASLMPLLLDPAAKIKDAALSQFPRRVSQNNLMGYALRNDRWRYIAWIDRESGETVATELYDHQNDPGEMRNLSRDLKTRGVCDMLHRLLKDRLPDPLPRVDAVGKRSPPRPRLTFVNESSLPATVYWLPKNGAPRKSGTIPPGRAHVIKTTIGHRFRVVSSDGVELETVATKQEETVPFTGEGQGSRRKPLAGKNRARLNSPPDIVVIAGDDWSWPHASILGDPAVKTPSFDRIAREGVLFENAFVSAPSCTPSRLAIATGQSHWRLGEGANLGGSLAGSVKVYADQLAEAGYRTGFARKGAAPSKNAHRETDPFGERFKDFAAFLETVANDQSFCFWYGAGEPHRPYDWKSSRREGGPAINSIEVPPFLPDNVVIRTDLADYLLRVQSLDQLAGEILKTLQRKNRLENAIVVMTSDNGMPFPRAKATLYDSGVRVPLAVRWGREIKGSHKVEDFVSLCDLAPTFLEAAGLSVPKEMTGRSLLPILLSGKSGQIEKVRDHVLTGMERHVYPNPSRAIRTRDFLYIRNFSPQSWPTGVISGTEPVYDFEKTPWPAGPGAFSYNIDPGPSKQWMIQHPPKPPQQDQVFAVRPAEELYDLRADPHQLNNLIVELSGQWPAGIGEKRRELFSRLSNQLRASGDPRFERPGYATFPIRGWTVHLNEKLWIEEPDVTRRMLALLDGQLNRVAAAVPKLALTELRKIPLWINPPYPGKRPGAEYHPDEDWLVENGRDSEMTRAVELTNASIFPFENRRMPFLLLHELAHGYHHRFLPGAYQNQEIRAAFTAARESGDYDEVPRFDGIQTVKDKAYAMTNPMEYFAETSEAYFGKNDFFPFTNDELKIHDPGMYKLLGKLWGVPEKLDLR